MRRQPIANRLPVLTAVLALSSLGACAGTGTGSVGTVEGERYVCVDPRPEACTMDYNPVCATLADGTVATYPNGCGACSDAAVVSHRPGACE
jgi:hypothetical protein